MVFADTSYYLALLHPRDRWHPLAKKLATSSCDEILTSEFVILELGALMAKESLRRLFIEWTHDLYTDPTITVVAANSDIVAEALHLYAQRPDKEWSLVDCTSFVIMRQYKVVEVLTSDHHFKQAGFTPLLQE